MSLIKIHQVEVEDEKIMTLNMTHYMLRDHHIKEYIANSSFKTLEPVRRINLAGANITHEGLQYLEHMLFPPYHVTYLNINDVLLNAQEIQWIASVIGNPRSTLTHLSFTMAWKCLNDANVLCQALASPHCHIQKLCISRHHQSLYPNDMDRLAETIAFIITHNTSITFLSVTMYSFEAKHMILIGNAIQCNTTLSTLYIYGGDTVKKEGFDPILKGLERNNAIVHFALQIDGGDSQYVEPILAVIHGHPVMETFTVFSFPQYDSLTFPFGQLNKMRKRETKSKIAAADLGHSLSPRVFQKLLWKK